MIDSSKLDKSYRQQKNTCVLASYAIVHNYFTDQPIGATFEAYCRHFGIWFSSWQDAERRHERHFDLEWQRRNCRGYQVILDLHENSDQLAFVAARTVFETKFHLDAQAEMTSIDSLLRSTEAILNISYRPHGQGWCHSVNVACDAKGFFIWDTNSPGIQYISDMTRLNVMLDGMIHMKK